MTTEEELNNLAGRIRALEKGRASYSQVTHDRLDAIEARIRTLGQIMTERLARLEARVVTIEEELDHCDVVRSFRSHSSHRSHDAVQGGHAIGPDGRNSWGGSSSFGDWPQSLKDVADSLRPPQPPMSPALRQALYLLLYFPRDAQVIFQLAPRYTGSKNSVMVGELRDALEALDDPKARSLVDGEEGIRPPDEGPESPAPVA